MNRSEMLEQLLFRRQAEELVGMTRHAFQYHLDQGHIVPCKEEGEGRAKTQLFWKDEIEALKNGNYKTGGIPMTLTQEQKQEVTTFCQSVGFLLGCLKHSYPNLEKTALYDNLTIPTNLRDAEKVRNRLLPVVEQDLLPKVAFDDQTTKEHILNLIRYEFNLSPQQAKRENLGLTVWLNLSEGYEHLKKYLG